MSSSLENLCHSTDLAQSLSISTTLTRSVSTSADTVCKRVRLSDATEAHSTNWDRSNKLETHHLLVHKSPKVIKHFFKLKFQLFNAINTKCFSLNNPLSNCKLTL